MGPLHDDGTTKAMNGGEPVMERTFIEVDLEQEVSPLSPSFRQHGPFWTFGRALLVMAMISGSCLGLFVLSSFSSDSRVEEESSSRHGGVAKATVKDETSQPYSTHLPLAEFSHDQVQHVRELQFVTVEPKSVVNTITNQLNLRAYEAYFVRSGIVPEVTGDGPFTMITPWRRPVMELDQALTAKLQNPSWRAHARALIQLHVFKGDASPTTFEDSTTLIMENGQQLEISRREGTVNQFFINGTLAVASTAGTNGYLYMSDQVLEPDWLWRTLQGVLATDYATFSELIVFAEMEVTLNGGPFTIFAPNNDAFNDDLVASLRTEGNKNILKSTLEYHILIGDPIAILNVAPQLPFDFATLNGETIRLVANGNTIAVEGVLNQASIVQEDVLVNNGIIQKLDTVLMVQGMDDLTETPTTSPVGLPTATPTISPARQIPSLNDLVQDTMVLSFIKSASDITGLRQEWDSDGPFTAFFPWDFAINRDSSFQKLQSEHWKGHLRDTLMGWIYNGDLSRENAGYQKDIEMMNGDQVAVRIEEDKRVYVNDNRDIGCPDLSNGFSCLYQDIIYPSWWTTSLLEIMAPSYSTLSILLEVVNIELNVEQGTIFAPTDQAFLDLGVDALAVLQNPVNAALLSALLQFHVAPTNTPSINFLSSGILTVPTLFEGESLGIYADESEQWVVQGPVNSAIIVNQDIFAANGIVHEIDAVLQIEQP